jgi:phage baseplate assembly protein W
MPYKNFTIPSANPIQDQAPQTSQFYVGFSTIDSTNTGSKLYDFDLIKQDLINNFNTKRGERVMNPTYGSIIWELLFEPLTPDVQDQIRQDVMNICNSDPRIYPTQIDISEYPQGYLIELTLVLNYNNQSVNLALAFDQEVGLVTQQQ